MRVAVGGNGAWSAVSHDSIVPAREENVLNEHSIRVSHAGRRRRQGERKTRCGVAAGFVVEILDELVEVM